MKWFRRGWGGHLRLAPLAILLLGGCSAVAIQTPGTVPSFPDARSDTGLDEEAMPVQALADEASFIQHLEQHGATHVIRVRSYVNDRVVDAVAADGLRHIYLFADGTYAGRLDIRCDVGREPIRPFLKIVYGKKRFGVLLVADNLALDGKRIAQLILVGTGGKKTHVSLTLDALEKKHGGMMDPYVGGDDLASGIILCARNFSGKAWDTVFVLSESGESVKVEKMPRIYAHGCPCFMDWILGRSTKDILGKNP